MLEGGLMKYLGKGATGRIVEESEDRLNQLIQVKIQVRVSKKGQMTGGLDNYFRFSKTTCKTDTIVTLWLSFSARSSMLLLWWAISS